MVLRILTKNSQCAIVILAVIFTSLLIIIIENIMKRGRK